MEPTPVAGIQPSIGARVLSNLTSAISSSLSAEKIVYESREIMIDAASMLEAEPQLPHMDAAAQKRLREKVERQVDRNDGGTTSLLTAYQLKKDSTKIWKEVTNAIRKGKMETIVRAQMQQQPGLPPANPPPPVAPPAPTTPTSTLPSAPTAIPLSPTSTGDTSVSHETPPGIATAVEIGPIGWGDDLAGQVRALVETLPRGYMGNKEITTCVQHSSKPNVVVAYFPSAVDAIQFMNSWGQEAPEGFRDVIVELSMEDGENPDDGN